MKNKWVTGFFPVTHINFKLVDLAFKAFNNAYFVALFFGINIMKILGLGGVLGNFPAQILNPGFCGLGFVGKKHPPGDCPGGRGHCRPLCSGRRVPDPAEPLA